MSEQRARILRPYTQRVRDARYLAGKTIAVTLLVITAMFMGLTLALFGLPGLFIPLTPILILIGFMLWLSPDSDPDLDKPIERTFYFFFAVALMWPNYIALNIPGLPWVSFQRIVALVIIALGFYAISSSKRVRGEIGEVLRSSTPIRRLFLAWVALQFIMLFVARLETMERWVHYQLVWNFMFLMALWVMRRPGRPQRMQYLLIIGIIVTSLLVIPEVRREQVLWATSIPSWLGVDPEVQVKLIEGSRRSGLYRAISIYLTSVTYGEYIAVSVPFVLYAIFHAKTPIRFALAIAVFALLFNAAYQTNTRTSMVGFVIATGVFSALWIARRFRENFHKRDVLSAAMFWGFPAAGLAFLSVILSVNRIRVRVLGGSEHEASDAGRDAQWDMAIPKIIRNPFGYGVDTVGIHVPYTNLAGIPTIDSYFINLLIDYGIPGFLIFLGLFIAGSITGAKVYINSENRDEDIAGPAAVSLFIFLFTRSVLSSEGAQFLAFMLTAMILALHWRQQQRAPAKAPAQPVEPLYGLPPRRIGALARNR